MHIEKITLIVRVRGQTPGISCFISELKYDTSKKKYNTFKLDGNNKCFKLFLS